MGCTMPLKSLPGRTCWPVSGGTAFFASGSSGGSAYSAFAIQPPSIFVVPTLGNQLNPGGSAGAKRRTASWFTPAFKSVGGIR